MVKFVDEMTVTEAAAASLTDRKYSPNEEVFIAPEEWGSVTYVGTRAEWEAEIPLDEDEAARQNIWYVCYQAAAADDMDAFDEPYGAAWDNWQDYRADMRSKLTPVTIIEEETN